MLQTQRQPLKKNKKSKKKKYDWYFQRGEKQKYFMSTNTLLLMPKKAEKE